MTCSVRKISKSLRKIEYYQLQKILDNIYDKSKNNYKFKNLENLILNNENILLAYRNLKTNKGNRTPGVDGKTIKEIEKYKDEYVINKIKSMYKNYIPSMIRRIEIPKPNGKIRPLGIPTIWDKLFQQCIKQILEPICEAKFYNHSYGFRANRDAHDALARCFSLVNRAKMYYVINVDIKSFFDNVDHSKLIKQLWTIGIRDKSFLKIISKILKAEVKDFGKQNKGTPQGGVLSPLLANIYLNELDWWISKQWDTIPTRHEFKQGTKKKNDNSSKRCSLKKTKLTRPVH